MPTELELLDMHVEALFRHDDEGRLVCLNDEERSPAPRVYLGRTREGNIWRTGAGLSPDVRSELEDLCAQEPVTDDLAAPPRHDAAYRRILSPSRDPWFGPAMAFAELPVIALSNDLRLIEPGHAAQLRQGMDEWMGDVDTCQPVTARFVDGAAVAISASVRITDRAYEAGVETRQDHRGRGFAGEVVRAWASAVGRLGRVPMYSTSWDNAASRAVARKLGLEPYASDYHIT